MTRMDRLSRHVWLADSALKEARDRLSACRRAANEAHRMLAEAWSQRINPKRRTA
jgi:hypothetical protein